MLIYDSHAMTAYYNGRTDTWVVHHSLGDHVEVVKCGKELIGLIKEDYESNDKEFYQCDRELLEILQGY